MKFLTTANPRLYRAYLLKEDLRLALKAGYESVGELLRKWMSWAQRCRIPEFRELRKKIKRNMTGILATAKHKLSNARIEAINNKIKLIIRRAYGFRKVPKNNPCKRITHTAASRLGKQPNKATLRSDAAGYVQNFL